MNVFLDNSMHLGSLLKIALGVGAIQVCLCPTPPHNFPLNSNISRREEPRESCHVRCFFAFSLASLLQWKDSSDTKGVIR